MHRTMLICKECGNLFLMPRFNMEHFDYRGADCSQIAFSSPCCFADFNIVARCYSCSEYITGDYIKYYDDRMCEYVKICENCYTKHNACEDENV